MKNTRTFLLPRGLEVVVGQENAMNRPAAVQRDGVRLRKYRIGNVDTSKAELVAFEAFRRFTGVELHPAEVGHLIEKINGEEYWTLSPYSAGEVTNNG